MQDTVFADDRLCVRVRMLYILIDLTDTKIAGPVKKSLHRLVHNFDWD